MPLTRLRALAFGAALGLVIQGCAGAPGAVVMASGRDEHGLVERTAVDLRRSPVDATVVASVPDSSFLRVVRSDRAWLLVRSLADPGAEGWVNDHDLRGVAVWTTRRVQVRFKDARLRDGGVEILVEPVGGGEAVWVAASELREVGAQ